MSDRRVQESECLQPISVSDHVIKGHTHRSRVDVEPICPQPNVSIGARAVRSWIRAKLPNPVGSDLMFASPPVDNTSVVESRIVRPIGAYRTAAYDKTS